MVQLSSLDIQFCTLYFINQKIMIIQPSHHHSQQQYSDEFDEGVLSIFETMLIKTQQYLNQDTKKQTQRLRRFYEEKVYLSFCDDPSQYLMHMLQKSQSTHNDHVAQIIMGRQNKVVTAIKNQKYEVKVNNQTQKLKKIKDELSYKLNDMRNNLSFLDSPSKMEQKSEEIAKGFMEFRKRGYWNEQTEQSKKVKSFLGKMRKQRHKILSEHEKNLKKSQLAIKQDIEKDKKQKEQQQKKIFEQISKRRQKIKSERINKQSQHEKRVSQANSFLEKFKTQKPVYITNEEKFKKEVLEPMEEQKKRKLKEIKKNRKPLDPDELQLHAQRYEQFRQKMFQAFEKKQQDHQLYEKNMERLKELYHGHFHEKVIQQMNSYDDMLEQKRKIRQRINSYSSGVKQQFKPKIDKRKREQIQKLTKILEQKANQKGKKKIKNEDGSIIYEEISPNEHRKLGVSYLQDLRKLNEGKKRKEPEQRSSSMMDLSKKKIVYPDYLLQMRSKSRIETASTKSRNGWRKIISQQGFSNRDKYNSVMDHVSLLQHEAKQKQLELKYMKGGSKAMQLKERVDKYYLESVAAKMQVLKDVILKQ